MKRNITLFIMVLVAAVCWAKSDKDTTMTVYGGVFDSFTGAAIKTAKVYVLRPDSTIVPQGTDSTKVDTLEVHSYEDWQTKRQQVRFYGSVPKEKANYILKAVDDNYETTYLPFSVTNIKREYMDLPDLKMKRRTHANVDLDELVVKATKIQMVYRGDTIVYDASAFVLPEGSMLDALIRQLPGAEMTSDGEITINGKKVDYLTLNGKDFFKGDNKVMLENLPYFTVKELKAYEKQDEKDKALGRDDNTKEKDYVLDVVLKREYKRGYIVNTEVGGGTEERWMAKLFGLAYGETSRISVYANANNTNEERKPGDNGDWDPTKTSRGLIKTKEVGVHYDESDKFDKWTNTLEAKAQWKDTDNSQTYNSETYRTGAANIHSAGFNNNKNAVKDFSMNNEFRIKKPYWLGVYTNISYRLHDYNSHSADSTWQTQLTNSSFSFLRNKYRMFDANMRANFSKDLSWGDYFDISASGGYNSNKPTDSYSLTRTDYASQPTDLRNQYGNNDSWSYNYSFDASYYHPIKKRLMTLSMNVAYRSNGNHHNNLNYRLDSLDGRYREEMGVLPSTVDSIAYAMDAYNSHEYKTRTNTIEVRPGISKQWRNMTTDKDGKETTRSWGYLWMSLPMNFVSDKIDFWRPKEAEGLTNNASAERSSRFFNPYIHFQWAHTSKIKFRLTAQRTEFAPSLTTLIDMSNTTNPLYLTVNNPHLKNTSRYNGNARLEIKCDSIPLNYWAEMRFNATHNGVGNRRWFNPTTGGYLSMQDNVNGNWNGRLSAGGSWQFDKKKRWRITLDGYLNYDHSVDFSLQQVENGEWKMENLLSQSSALSTVNTLNTNARLQLTYRKDQFTATLLGRVDGRHSRSDREDFTNLDSYEFKYGVNTTYTTPKTFGAFTIATDYTIHMRRGYTSSEMNTTMNLWNASIAKTFLKGTLTAKITAYDILRQVSNIGYSVNAQGYTERRYNSIPRYVMFSMAYKLTKKPKK